MDNFAITSWNGYPHYVCTRTVNGKQCNFDVLDDEDAMRMHQAEHDRMEANSATPQNVTPMEDDENEPYTVGTWCGYTQLKCRYCALDMLDDGAIMPGGMHKNARAEMEDHFVKSHYQAIEWQKHLEELRDELALHSNPQMPDGPESHEDVNPDEHPEVPEVVHTESDMAE